MDNAAKLDTYDICDLCHRAGIHTDGYEKWMIYPQSAGRDALGSAFRACTDHAALYDEQPTKYRIVRL